MWVTRYYFNIMRCTLHLQMKFIHILKQEPDQIKPSESFLQIKCILFLKLIKVQNILNQANGKGDQNVYSLQCGLGTQENLSRILTEQHPHVVPLPKKRQWLMVNWKSHHVLKGQH